MYRLSLAARLIVPALWLGLIIGISFLEAPLKFQAPGITIELGLGIGRLVFAAMNIVEGVFAILLVLAALRPRLTRTHVIVLGAIVLALLVKVALIRPSLNAETDLVLAGLSDGGSGWHYAYIACEVVLLGLLVTWLVLQVRAWLPAAPSGAKIVTTR